MAGGGAATFLRRAAAAWGLGTLLAVPGAHGAPPRDAPARTVTLTRRLAAVEHGAAALGEALESAAYARSLLSHERTESLRRLAAYRARSDARRRAARRRGKALYKLSRGGALRVLLADDPAATATRVTKARTVRALVRHDLRELATYAGAEARARAELAAVVRSEQALGVVTAFGEVQADLVEAGRARLARAARRALRATRHGHGVPARWRRELSRARAELRRARYRLLRPGGLVRPVNGRIVGRFGPYRDPLLRVPMSRTGVELSARPGRPVRAVAPGTVAFAGPLPEYGQVVVLDHGDGFLSVTGRLMGLQVAPGAEVEAGQVLGSVAPKQVPDGLGSTVYLELRHGTRPIDPRPYLARRRRSARGVSSGP